MTMTESDKGTSRKHNSEPLQRGNDAPVTSSVPSERDSNIFRISFQSSPVGQFIFSMENKCFIDANPTFVQMVGYSKDELGTRSILHILSPEDQSRILRFLDKIQRKEIDGFEIDLTFLNKDNRNVDSRLLISSCPPTEEYSNVVLGHVIDISKNKLAEELISIQRDLGIALSSASDLEDALGQILEAIIRVEDIDSGAVYSIDENTGDLILLHCIGISQDFISKVDRHPASSWEAQTVIAGKTIILNHEDLEQLPTSYMYREGFRTVAVIPIKHGDKVMGCLVTSSHTNDVFPVNAQHTLEAIATQVGGVIVRFAYERTLKASEKRFQESAEMLPLTIFEIDTAGYVKYANQRGLNIFGYTRDDLENDFRFLDMIAPEDRERALGNLDQTIIGHAPGLLEYTAIRKDGTTFPALMQASVVYQDEDPMGMRGFFLDITDRKNTELALRENERLYRLLAENTSDIILKHSVDGTIDYISPSVESIQGFHPDEMRGTSIFDFIDPDHHDHVREIGRTLFKQRAIISLEYRSRHKKGHYVWMETTSKPLLDASTNKVIGIIGTSRDITSRKQAEEDLQWELSLNTALAKLGGSLLSETEGIATFAYTLLEESLKLTQSPFGYVSSVCPETKENRILTPISLMPKHCACVVDNGLIDFTCDIDNVCPSIWRESLSKGRPLYINMDDGPNPTDSQRCLSMPVVLSGSVIGQIGLSDSDRDYGPRDIQALERLADLLALALDRNRAIAEKEEMSERLRQSQKMEAIGTLAGGVAHDFNNILWAIQGFAEMAMLEVPEGGIPAVNLASILEASARGRDLVQQIQAFSRRNKPERKPLRLGPSIKETLKLLRASLPTTIEIHSELADETGAVLADPTQIIQVLMNLATNAAHAMKSGNGIIKIALEEVDINTAKADLHPDLKPGPYLKLSVGDTGKGIDPMIVNRIFEPYFTTKEKGEGTGLGLAVAHGIIKNHGGTITVESQPGQGAVFHVYFPKMEQASAERAIQISQVTLTGSERILFVDDEPALVEVATQMLEYLGYNVTTRHSSLDALEAIRAAPDRFDLLITDLTMPHISGLDLIREVKTIRPNMPVILLTGFSNMISEDKAKDLGINAVAKKPISVSKISEVIREVLGEG